MIITEYKKGVNPIPIPIAVTPVATCQGRIHHFSSLFLGREFDSFIFQKILAGLIKPAFFMSNCLFYFIVLYSIFKQGMIYYIQEGFTMKVTTSKSKNSESFYIAKSFINNKGKSTSVNVRKLGTLKELLVEHGPTRDDVMKWAREEARIETLKYKKNNRPKLSR